MEKEEFIKIELNTLIEEFKLARETMLFDLNLGRQVVNVTLTATGILLAASPFIILNSYFSLFLIAPLLFYPLA